MTIEERFYIGSSGVRVQVAWAFMAAGAVPYAHNNNGLRKPYAVEGSLSEIK